jgi:hypothetical protein
VTLDLPMEMAAAARPHARLNRAITALMWLASLVYAQLACNTVLIVLMGFLAPLVTL